MPSLSKLVAAFGLLVALSGGLVGAYGLYQQATDTCESGTGLTISRLDATETADPDLKRVAYEDLSSAEREMFREILTAETTPVYQDSSALDGLSRNVVTYRGHRYRTSELFVSDCFDGYGLYIAFGGIVALAGGLVATGAFAWRRAG